jgi:hypothetical protein
MFPFFLMLPFHPRRPLAPRTKKTTPPRHNRPSYHPTTSKTFLPLPLIHPMPQLKFPTLPIRVHIIRHRRPARPDRLRQHAMNRLIQSLHFTLAQFRSQPPRMNLRAPQTLIRINIPHPAEHALIHQERFDLRTPARDRLPKIFLAHLQRIESQPSNQCLALPIEKDPYPPKSPNIRVTKLAPIVQRKKEMRMRRNGSHRRSHHNLPGHAQMHQQRNFPAVFSAPFPLEPNDHEFAESFDARNTCPRQFPLERRRIINKIRLRTQTHAHDSPPRQHQPQATHHSLHFRKFRHLVHKGSTDKSGRGSALTLC